jgi:phosphoserine phosphatase
MKRPALIQFLAIQSGDSLSIRVALAMEKIIYSNLPIPHLATHTLPVQSLHLLSAGRFRIRLICLNADHQELYNQVFDSDSFGHFHLRINTKNFSSTVKAIQLYEIRRAPGLELLLGTFLPFVLSSPLKIIISDLDKTLVDTRSRTIMDIYHSLTWPLSKFPAVPSGMDILSHHVEHGFFPFILSASPHFYEHMVQNWLHTHRIYNAGIFLKDYRQILGVLGGVLSYKDFKVQGLYKLNHLLDILLMCGIPDELIMMGDDYQEDPIIYLTLSSLLLNPEGPPALWNQFRRHQSFRLNDIQNARFINKFHALKNILAERSRKGTFSPTQIKIHIRTQNLKKPSLPAPILPSPRPIEELFEFFA